MPFSRAKTADYHALDCISGIFGNINCDMDTERNIKSGRVNIFASRQLGSFLIMGLLLASIVVCFMILSPYIYPIVLAALFAMIFYPVYQIILKKVKNRPSLASGITCILISLFVIVPILAFASMLIVRGTSTYTTIQTWIEEGSLRKELYEFGLAESPVEPPAQDGEESPDENGETPPESIEKQSPPSDDMTIVSDTAVSRQITVAKKRFSWENLKKLSWKRKVGTVILVFIDKVLQKDRAELEKEVIDSTKTAVEFLGPKVLNQAKKGIGMVVSFFLMMFVLFYLFRDGKTIMDYLLDLSPLKKEHEDLLIDRVKSVTRSAVVGTFLTAVAQGILGMISFAIVGIPWFFWGVIMGFASLIPVVGTALVWVPCCIFLLIVGDTWQAVFLLIYSIVVVGSADNFLRPFFMKGDTGMSSIIAFFAILGGIEFFGLIGVVFGPLIFGVCAMLLYIYKLELQEAEEDAITNVPSALTSPPKPEATPDKKSEKEEQEEIGE